MALSSLRLRRGLSLSSSLIRHQRPFSAVPTITGSPSLSSLTVNGSPILDLIQPHHHHLLSNSRHFRSSSAWLLSARSSQRNNYANNDEIGPDTILFEGCDYNHWLITMDFPKDPAPTREEMIETYLQTVAKVVGSYEEAKKRMYAFSTTTYHGFQCLVTEEMSEKFKGLPGVVFVLPDSYIDPVNKEYGGDKYDNGVITPRPPPLQYGRQGGRYGDRNRDFNRNRPRGPSPNQQDIPAYGNQGSMYGDTRNFGQQNNSPVQPNYGNQGPVYGDTRNFKQQQTMQPSFGNQVPTYGDTRNFGQQQNTPMQPNYVNSGPMSNYGPGGAGDRRDPMAMNNAPGGGDPMPSYQATNSQNQQGYYNSGPMSNTRNFGQQQNTPMQPNYVNSGPMSNYGPGGAGDRRDPMAMNNAPGGGDPMPSYQATNSQNQQGYYNSQGGRIPPEQRDYGPGVADNRRDSMPMYNAPGGRDPMSSYRATNSQNQQGYHNPQGGRMLLEQRDYVPSGQWDMRGDNRNYAPPQAVTYGQGAGGNYGQGVGTAQGQETGFGYGQTNSRHGEEQRFSPVEQRSNMQGEQGNYAQTGTDQNRHVPSKF